MKAIHTYGAPTAIGPYSQATFKKGFLFISGQIGIDPATGQLGKSFEAQADQIFTSLSNILNAANMSFRNVVKVTIFIEDLMNFESLNKIYARNFSEPYPARETVQVSRLPLNAALEISLIACDL
ncbi:MAG: Rid family detoxifying hydrolase [Candidatus Cloacimonetes bacterium]|nr:Rid family detoxifying hydrolase [Candidatus Cloacimonadota bacterium]